MILTDARARKDKKNLPPEEPKVVPANIAALKAHIRNEVRKAGIPGIELAEIMRVRREDKKGPAFWQFITDEQWIAAAKELEAEWNAEEAAEIGSGIVEPKVVDSPVVEEK